MSPNPKPNAFNIGDIKKKAEEGIKAAELKRRKDAIETAKAVYVPYKYSLEELEPENWVIDGFINDKITLFAGMEGDGKSTGIAYLGAIVAGLYKPEGITVQGRRKVIYIIEDPKQLSQILYGIRKHHAPDISEEEFQEYFHIIPSRRQPMEVIAGLASIVQDYTTVHKGVTLYPLVIFDTTNATIEIENESDNAQVGAVIAAMKEAFQSRGLTIPIWLIAHIPKMSQSQTENIREIRTVSARGASAWSGDVNTTVILGRSGEDRILALKKRRYHPDYTEIRMSGRYEVTTVHNQFKDVVPQSYPLLTLAISYEADRIARLEVEKTKSKDAELESLKRKVLDKVANAKYPSRTFITEGMAKRPGEVSEVIVSLLAAGELTETTLTADMRKKFDLNNRQKSFLSVSNAHPCSSADSEVTGSNGGKK